MEIIENVRAFVVDTFLFGESERLSNDSSFIGERIVDSTGMMELISFLEQHFGVTIDDTELIPENLDSVNNIRRFLLRKLASEGAG